MIDFYWLKSFTEIMQLFLSVLFLIYLKIKFDRPTPIIYWIAVFFSIKLATDLFGILNYTPWIADILTKHILGVYRAGMASFEVDMIVSLLFFVESKQGSGISPKRKLLLFTLAFAFFPINLALRHYFEFSIVWIFDVVKSMWIIVLIYAINSLKNKTLIAVIITMLLWNILWLAEVVLHQQTGTISESTSWVMFVISEFILTIGLSYFLVQIIAHPRLLRSDKPEDVLPLGLVESIELQLEKVFLKEQLYKNIDLTSQALADQMNISVNDLSTYLNKVKSKNFNQFLIDHRIEESKRLLDKPSSSDSTIEQIMLQSGFNSKSVFNTAFKKKTGITPSQYRKRTQSVG